MHPRKLQSQAEQIELKIGYWDHIVLKPKYATIRTGYEPFGFKITDTERYKTIPSIFFVTFATKVDLKLVKCHLKTFQNRICVQIFDKNNS